MREDSMWIDMSITAGRVITKVDSLQNIPFSQGSLSPYFEPMKRGAVCTTLIYTNA